MKKIIIILVIISLIIGIVLYFINKNRDDCHAITGGGFTLFFETNGGNEINPMHVCIACPPDSYDDLPVPVKDGYIFVGWYYDKNFKNSVDGMNSLNIKPNAITSKKEWCIIGYKDVTIYAKWKK